MAELRAPEQNILLGRLANMLRATEGDIAAPEFLPRGLDVMGLVRQLMLPSAETVEKLSYGDPLFRMPTQSNIPITADREYLADVVGMAPMLPAASRATTRLSNEAADQLVRAITGTQATAPQVLEAAGQMLPMSRMISPEIAAKVFPDTKVVDEAGNPKLLYHGTNKEFEQFDESMLGTKTGNPTSKMGYFFSDSPSEASRYAADWGKEGGNVRPVYLDIKNPKRLTYKQMNDISMALFDESSSLPVNAWKTKEGQAAIEASAIAGQKRANKMAMDLRQQLIDEGYDGAVVRIGGKDEYIAFNPNQIKSAISDPQMAGLLDQPAQSVSSSLLDDIVKKAQDKKIDLQVAETDSLIDVGLIKVPKRGKGLGTETMQELTEYADRTGKPIRLIPDPNIAKNVDPERLVSFYERLGFVKQEPVTSQSASGSTFRQFAPTYWVYTPK